ncbi:hypothetical protein Cfor_05193 [Coptotermes formosanus]|jgi:hypothetical protein|uniref:Transposase n=1 Tax=Coptotermes formosanus TaxID=36987 RepID=A0A6L2PZ35_COPFO|nr:hypothetical protein Cfor_05193 [Coptotermes formosanus]
MSSEDFENLICRVDPAVNKKNTKFRNATSLTGRLAIALIFPAAGDSYDSKMYLFEA